MVFFKKLWQHIKQEVMGMVRDFNEIRLDLQRLNYGVITLVSKVREANSIKQHRSICLLNVDFKIFPKLLIDKLTPMVDKLISTNQTTFIKGTKILEGVVILHEILYEFRKFRKQGGSFSKLTLKRPMIRLSGSLFKISCVEKASLRNGSNKPCLLCKVVGYAPMRMGT
jgi:hypothetical protein